MKTKIIKCSKCNREAVFETNNKPMCCIHANEYADSFPKNPYVIKTINENWGSKFD